ncbi:hypothetical protein BOX15_Mlig020479g1 [Macrostomum lignano]|uniref:Uncharacterized protein n=2 Tax=Macrostomum lignano TaxID=282301 RepID=A0A267ETW0_9PLAT|nr:hypothetical protein BOX15_Mlig025835g1 [Macrostomum lignano]PAA87528.1 hypothetical protein BOX15_Mlig020479g2 [Macrostomum lignano]PAA90374.1 hypothetical protein BOX15_Mlig020479g1 [Macrostomum lignano]
MSTFKSSGGKGVDLCLSWVNAANGEIPAGAVSIGGDVFVARCFSDGELLPGKVAAGHNSCYAPYDGEEKCCDTYQVLCETCNHGLTGGPGFEWVAWSGNTAPKHALISGSDQGRPLYVAKANIDGEWCAGKYIPDYGKAYFSCGGAEHEKEDDFEVLVMCTRSG